MTLENNVIKSRIKIDIDVELPVDVDIDEYINAVTKEVERSTNEMIGVKVVNVTLVKDPIPEMFSG